MVTFTLSYLYKRLTQWFCNLEVHRSQVSEMQYYLKFYIASYASMALFNLALCIAKAVQPFAFATSLIQMVCDLLLDIFTIGITLWLNWKASKAYRQKQRLQQS